MLISLQSTITTCTTKGKPALIFDDSRFTLNRIMGYATGDMQKGPVLLESPLRGMTSNTKLHHTIMLWM